jgi:hypothetical protein
VTLDWIEHEPDEIERDERPAPPLTKKTPPVTWTGPETVMPESIEHFPEMTDNEERVPPAENSDTPVSWSIVREGIVALSNVTVPVALTMKPPVVATTVLPPKEWLTLPERVSEYDPRFNVVLGAIASDPVEAPNAPRVVAPVKLMVPPDDAKLFTIPDRRVPETSSVPPPLLMAPIENC